MRSFFRVCTTAIVLSVATRAALASGVGDSNVATTPNAALATRIHSGATTNATSVQPSLTSFFGCIVVNGASSTEYLKVYNKASAPVVGTDTPAFTLPLPPSKPIAALAIPITLSTGFAYAITANEADSDTTAVGAGDVDGFCGYE
jgi:hypothetical protein